MINATSFFYFKVIFTIDLEDIVEIINECEGR